MESQTTCPECQSNISLSDYFCPNCGKKLKEKPLSTTLLKQLLIYLVSFFLPPLGIWPAIKYLRQSDKKSKKIGLVAVFLTIISIVITSWLTISFINSFNQKIGSQLDLYQGLDY
ncbi:MAG TPA: zinc ribbon domain-containing protein [Patescibacteria group bacterium]|nr:zinc ribbon domain-containing protein [Patescibacteria group bacterium]